MGVESDGARWGVTRALCVVGLASCLHGCAAPARQTFDLSLPSAPASVAAGGAALAVREPIAVAPTNSDRVTVRGADGGVYVLPDVQWSEELPGLLRNRMIGALQGAGVSAARISAGANRALATDIRRFEIDVARDVAVVEIAARLVDEASGATRAAQIFAAEAPAPEHTGAPAVHALTEAAAQALSRLAAWARDRG